MTSLESEANNRRNGMVFTFYWKGFHNVPRYIINEYIYEPDVKRNVIMYIFCEKCFTIYWNGQILFRLWFVACIYCFLQKFGKFPDFHCLYEGTFYCGIIFTIAHTTYFHFSIHHFDPTQVKCRLLISSIFDAMNFQHFLEMQEIMLQHGEIPRQGKIKLSKLMSFHFSYFKNIIKLLRK